MLYMVSIRDRTNHENEKEQHCHVRKHNLGKKIWSNVLYIQDTCEMPTYRDIHTQFCDGLARVWFIHSQIGTDCWEIVTFVTGNKVLKCTASAGFSHNYLSVWMTYSRRIGRRQNWPRRPGDGLPRDVGDVLKCWFINIFVVWLRPHMCALTVLEIFTLGTDLTGTPTHMPWLGVQYNLVYRLMIRSERHRWL